MSAEIATNTPEGAEPRSRTTRHRLRAVTIQLLGPLTMLAGAVWAIAQPYRVVFLHPDGKGLYDFLFQPPLLVVVVGLLYTLLIAPELVSDLDREAHSSAR